jgi:hypothetical protein
MRGVLVGLVLLGGACQGELKLLHGMGGGGDGGTGPAPDLSTAADTVSFLDINRDFEEPALTCSTFASPACHGGTNPMGKMKLQSMALGNMTALMANYQQVMEAGKGRVNLAMPAESSLLTKSLTTRSDVMHGGPKPFKNDMDPVYRRWLQWILCGARFEAAKIETCPTVDMGGR